MANNLVNLIYPAHCPACKAVLPAGSEKPLCRPCSGKIKFAPKPYCSVCGRPMPNGSNLCADCQRRKFSFLSSRSVLLYDGPAVNLIHSFKYKGKIGLAKPLSGWIINFLKENMSILNGIDALTYVPSRDNIFNRRDYNHSKVLAGLVARHFGLKTINALRKKRYTKPQNALSREERLWNLKGAFRMSRLSSVFGLRILLIDDVMTTGATLDECAKTLIDNGAIEVKCLTLSRGI